MVKTASDWNKTCSQANKGGTSGPLEYQRSVGAAKTEVVFYSHVYFGVTGGICAVVQVALRVLVEDVDGRRDFLVMQGQHCKDRLDASSAPEQVTGHGLGGTNDQLLGMFAKCCLDGIGLVEVTQRRGSAVGIEV